MSLAAEDRTGRAHRVAHLLAALGTLLGGGVLALGGAGLGAGVTAAFLVAAPATAVAVPLRGLDPLARIVLAVAAAVVVNALVAEVMLITGSWSPPGGVAAVSVISAVLWLAPGARPARPVAAAGSRREVITQAEPAPGEGTP